jgi:predicted nucleic acid-binding protein
VILVDTNIVLDIVRDDQEWEAWSASQLIEAAARDAVAINQIVYAELSSQYDTVEQIDAALTDLNLPIVEMPRAALFLAGQAFREYRRSGGARSNVLPDFFIGAHAAVEGASVLTRDPKRIRSYFPTVTLVSPRSA